MTNQAVQAARAASPGTGRFAPGPPQIGYRVLDGCLTSGSGTPRTERCSRYDVSRPARYIPARTVLCRTADVPRTVGIQDNCAPRDQGNHVNFSEEP